VDGDGQQITLGASDARLTRISIGFQKSRVQELVEDGDELVFANPLLWQIGGRAAES
jgi:hypothetical protein